MEPWDGPAAVVFTDGRLAGAVLDRNGLRPGRWIQDTEGYVVLASEAGVMTVAPEHVQRKGRLAPGKLFWSTSKRAGSSPTRRPSARRRGASPTPSGTSARSSTSTTCPTASLVRPGSSRFAQSSWRSATRRKTCGWSSRRWRPRARSRSRAWATTPRWRCCPTASRRLFSYFKQLFAQVTNPPIDPIRESIVMSLQAGVGAEVNLLSESPDQAHILVMDQPILRNHELEKLRQVSHDVFDAATLDITWPVEQGPSGIEPRLQALCEEAARTSTTAPTS
jgi:Glutamate synthase domain 1